MQYKRFFEEATPLQIALVICSIPASIIWWAYATTVLWEWLIVPVFNMPILSIVDAIGLRLSVSFLTYKRDDPNNEDGQTLSELLIRTFVTPAVFLLIGFIVKQWM